MPTKELGVGTMYDEKTQLVCAAGCLLRYVYHVQLRSKELREFYSTYAGGIIMNRDEYKEIVRRNDSLALAHLSPSERWESMVKWAETKIEETESDSIAQAWREAMNESETA